MMLHAQCRRYSSCPGFPALMLACLLLGHGATACRRLGQRCYVPGGSEGNSSSCCGEDPRKSSECFGGCCLVCNGPVKAPTSVCVKNKTACPAPAPPPPTPPPRPCTPEVLASGITLPCPWPPVGNMSRTVATPHYLTTPPAVISVDTGRQLFVDDFLVSATGGGVERQYMQAQYLTHAQGNPVMRPTEPWEARNMTYARAYSGGVWWIPEDGVFKMWYGCGTAPATDACLGLCLASSSDGIEWLKTPLDVVPGTNIVINTVLKSNNVWFDQGDKNKSARYKMADSGGVDLKRGFGWSYRLWSSPDGVHWHVEQNTTGPTSDRSTVFHNPLRTPKRWTFSIKNYQEQTLKLFGRSRLYWETANDDFYAAQWGKSRARAKDVLACQLRTSACVHPSCVYPSLCGYVCTLLCAVMFVPFCVWSCLYSSCLYTRHVYTRHVCTLVLRVAIVCSIVLPFSATPTVLHAT